MFSQLTSEELDTLLDKLSHARRTWWAIRMFTIQGRVETPDVVMVMLADIRETVDWVCKDVLSQ